MGNNLNKREQWVLDCIEAFYQREGYMPSFADLKVECKFGSKGMVAKYINRLEAKGAIARAEGVARSLQIL